jgi:phosphoglycerol transferase MdoB-like AlkP superfamily enzyme
VEKYKNFLAWFIFILYIELIFKVSIFNNFNLVYIFLFTIPLSLTIAVISSIFNKCINRIMSYLIIIFLTLIFIAQVIYYKTYLSIFSIYSIGKGGQIIEFADTILKIVLQNIFIIILLLVPLIIFIIFSKKVLIYEKIDAKKLLILLLSIIVFQILANISLFIDSKEEYSAKELYYDTNSPTLSANKLGLLTTMRIDFKRLIFGFKEKSKLNTNSVNNEDEEEILEYNTMDIDFDGLIANESNVAIKDMHTYFKNAPATNKNKYTGMFKGKNLIVFLAESFYPIAIDSELTPTLYKLANEGFKFPNFYNPVYPVSTSDGEYITATSLIPKEGVWSAYRSSSNYFPFVLGNAFKNIGYKTTAYHDHSATYYYRNLYIPNWGYDFYACKKGLNINCKIWPESDVEMIDKSYSSYINNEPFMTYYITVSGHLRYTKTGNMMAYRNWNYVEYLPYSDAVKAYIACNIEFDKALSNLIKYLTDVGKLDNTVIAISGDHYPYGLTLDEINEKSTYARDDNFEKHHSSFILWNSKMKPVTINKIGSSLDVLPTLLNLFGVEYDSRLLMGKDLLSESAPLVIFSNRSFITDKGRYDSINSTFESVDGKEVPKDYVKKINDEIYNKFYLSREIIDTDYYRKIFNR